MDHSPLWHCHGAAHQRSFEPILLLQLAASQCKLRVLECIMLRLLRQWCFGSAFAASSCFFFSAAIASCLSYCTQQQGGNRAHERVSDVSPCSRIHRLTTSRQSDPGTHSRICGGASTPGSHHTGLRRLWGSDSSRACTAHTQAQHTGQGAQASECLVACCQPATPGCLHHSVLPPSPPGSPSRSCSICNGTQHGRQITAAVGLSHSTQPGPPPVPGWTTTNAHKHHLVWPLASCLALSELSVVLSAVVRWDPDCLCYNPPIFPQPNATLLLAGRRSVLLLLEQMCAVLHPANCSARDSVGCLTDDRERFKGTAVHPWNPLHPPFDPRLSRHTQPPQARPIAAAAALTTSE